MGKLRGIVDQMDVLLDSFDDLDKVDAIATLSEHEWMYFGDKASLALAMNLVDAEDAQYLHEIHTNFNDRMLAERIVYLETMRALIDRF